MKTDDRARFVYKYLNEMQARQGGIKYLTFSEVGGILKGYVKSDIPDDIKITAYNRQRPYIFVVLNKIVELYPKNVIKAQAPYRQKPWYIKLIE